jgi:hypothetical protein
MHIARAPRIAALLSALAFMGACGASASEEKQPSVPAGRLSSGSGLSSGSAEGACRARARSACVTASDNGRTVAVAVGWTVEVDLRAPNSAWSDPMELGARLLRQRGEVGRAAGEVRVAYSARAPGKTELRAFERPLCRPARACPQFILVWLVHLRVSA